MTPVTDLESKLRALLDGAAQRRAVERREMERQMEVLGPKRAHWEQVADAWMRELVLPRLEALILGLPGRGRLEHLAGTLTGAVRIAWSPEFPVGASLTISIAPTPSLDGATFRARPQLIPMLAGSPSDSSYVTTAAATDDLTGARGFLDDAVLAFANAYLDSGEPESPHQRGSFVADPRSASFGFDTISAAGSSSDRQLCRSWFREASHETISGPYRTWGGSRRLLPSGLGPRPDRGAPLGLRKRVHTPDRPRSVARCSTPAVMTWSGERSSFADDVIQSLRRHGGER